MLNRLALSLLPLLLLPAPARGQDLHREGIPVVAERSHGVAPDGTRLTLWRVLLAVFTSRTVERPSGDISATWTLLPLFRRVTDTSTELSSWTAPFPVPLAHRSHDRQSHRTYVFPLLWYGRQAGETDVTSGFAVIPLLWRDSRLLRTHRSEITYAFPFWRLRLLAAEAEPGAAPLIDNFGLFPVTWGWRRDELDHVNVLYPLFIWEPGRRLHLVPFLWSGPGYFSIAPFYGWYAAQHQEMGASGAPVAVDERFEYWLFPLLIRFEQSRSDTSSPYVETHVLWPLLLWGDGGGRHERRLFPLWRHATAVTGSRETESTWILTPVHWSGRTTEEGRLIRAHDVIAPFYGRFEWLADQPFQAEGEIGVAPTDHELTVLLPLTFFHRVDGQPRSLWAPWPLFNAVWSAESADPQYPVFVWRLALILAGHQRTIEGDTRFSVLGWLFRRQVEDSEVRTQTLWRLVTTERDPAARTARFDILGGLLGYERLGDDRGLRLFTWR
ncbi:MAG: hypothetical protein HUU25_06430 [Candidatus Sumerlaeia bacterium]|nr:hypothetical protein [Candidatus Sumerlaeia bacterium]